MSGVWLAFALKRFVIGSKISRHFLIQSEVKPKSNKTRSYTSPRFCGGFMYSVRGLLYSIGLSVYLFNGQARVIGHFRVLLCLCFQNESKCEIFHMKMSSEYHFIFMEIKVIFIRMVSHLDSLWNRGTREHGNGLLLLILVFRLSIKNHCYFQFFLLFHEFQQIMPCLAIGKEN